MPSQHAGSLACLWLVCGAQVDREASGEVPPQRRIVLQAIAGAVLVDRQVGDVAGGVACRAHQQGTAGRGKQKQAGWA